MQTNIKKIIEYNRHHFIYGENTKERKKLLQSLDREYKIKVGENAPMTVYITTDSLLTRETVTSKTDDIIRLQIFAREQLSFTLAVAVLEKMKRDIPNDKLQEITASLLDHINSSCLNKNYPSIGSFAELIKAFKKSADFHKSNFLKEQRKEKLDDFSTLEIPFLEITSFISYMKKILKNDSFFAVLIDYQSKLSVFSQQAINNLIGGRINSDISIKVISEPEDWGYVFDMAGNRIDATHDYETEDLDGSLKRYTEKQKQAFYEKSSNKLELGGFAECEEDFDGTEEEFNAFNYCLAEDYLTALLEEDFTSLGETDSYLFKNIAYWLNYDGEIGKESENLIEGIPTGKFLTNRRRLFEEAVVENHNAYIARALIYNGNHNIELYLTVILNEVPYSDEDGLLNCIHSSLSDSNVENYCNFLENIFKGIGEQYDTIEDAKEKEQFLKKLKPFIKGIRFPKDYKDSVRLKEIARMKTENWQIKLREMMSKK